LKYYLPLPWYSLELPQFYVYTLQVKIMETQTAIQKKQTDIGEATQRAFVVVDGLQITKKEGGIASWELQPTIKNSGTTPTKNLVYTGLYVQLLEPRLPQNLETGLLGPNVPHDPAGVFYSAPKLDIRPLAVIGPQATLSAAPIKSGITQDRLDRMKELGYTRVTASGAILYNDVFPDSKRHITKYCYLIDPDTDFLDLCGYWNCADDDCKVDAEAYNKALDTAFRRAGKPTNPRELVPTDFP
jgi:hypothetical protein